MRLLGFACFAIAVFSVITASSIRAKVIRERIANAAEGVTTSEDDKRLNAEWGRSGKNIVTGVLSILLGIAITVLYPRG